MIAGIQTTAEIRTHMVRLMIGTFDHIIPTNLGGQDVRENGVAACQCCNSMKGHQPYDVFKAYIDHLVLHHIHPRQIFARSGLVFWPHSLSHKTLLQAAKRSGNAQR